MVHRGAYFGSLSLTGDISIRINYDNDNISSIAVLVKSHHLFFSLVEEL